MRKFTTLAAVIGGVLLSSAVMASDGEHNFQVGIAESGIKLSDSIEMTGLNAKYAFEPYGQKTGFISSITRTSENVRGVGGSDADTDFTYYSVLMGPSYYVTDFAAVYAVGGIGALNAKISSPSESESISDTGFVYGVGFKLNLYKEIVLDTHIEYSDMDLEDYDTDMTTFSVTVGGRF